jgi:hypothetical protein
MRFTSVYSGGWHEEWFMGVVRHVLYSKRWIYVSAVAYKLINTRVDFTNLFLFIYSNTSLQMLTNPNLSIKHSDLGWLKNR